MGPVGVCNAMIAVVKENDISEFDFLKAAAEVSCRLLIPIVSGNRPHYDPRKSHLLCSRMELRASKAEWRPDNVHGLAGGLRNGGFATP
jgi:hypothetical protein